MKELCILARLCSYENETPVRGAWRGLMVPRAGLSFLLSHDALRTNKRASSRVCVMNLLRSGLLICGNSRRPRQYSRGLIDTRRSREVWDSQKFYGHVYEIPSAQGFAHRGVVDRCPWALSLCPI